ncbi:hypothetical protein NMY22_g16426 [Coprinellus aureogranulatus]|nr:hypothetical protein NMY22_g16426 [Coprinellus aureogranulatus]
MAAIRLVSSANRASEANSKNLPDKQKCSKNMKKGAPPVDKLGKTQVNPVLKPLEGTSSPTRKLNNQPDSSQTAPAATETMSAEAAADQLPELKHGSLKSFFEIYQKQGFTYRADALPPAEYRRLCDFLRGRISNMKSKEEKGNWEKKRKEVYEEYARAMHAEFGLMFGKKMKDYGAWQRLCQRIGIDPIPATWKAARRAVKGTHVNIVELMTKSIRDGKMTRFKSEETLAKYTRRAEGRLTYPRVFVEKGDILEYLLRRINTAGLEDDLDVNT